MYSLVLGGGLGNQMFEYAFARTLSLEYGIDFIYNLYNYNVHSTEVEERNFSLANFNVINKDKFESRRKSIVMYNYHRFCTLLNLIPLKYFDGNKAAQLMANLGDFCSVQGTYKYNKTKLKRKNGVIIGYFQNEKYFKKYENTIREELMVITAVSPKNIDLYNQMKNTNSVAVHIRRGDYKSTRWSYLDVCTEKYYRNALKHFDKKNYKFFIFSNNHEDIEWIKKNYKFIPKDAVYVDNDNKDYEDMQLMYTCKHFIISNSTFSWWAQYLSKNPKKIVVAPSKWWKNQEEIPDIYQSNWILEDI